MENSKIEDGKNKGDGNGDGKENIKNSICDANILRNGSVLANQYELVRTIFSYLPMKDLESCSQVCSLWQKVQKICLKQRMRYNSASFYWCGRRADVSYYSKYPLFQSPHHHQLYEEMDKFCSEILLKPKLAIIFGSGDTEISVRDSSPGQEPEDHMEKSWLVDKGGVLSHLPKGCLAIGTTSRGIVGTSQGVSHEQENIFEENNLLHPAMSMLLIPEKPGVKILPFHLAENQLDPMIADIKKNSFYLESEAVLQERLLERAVPDLEKDDQIKAVILLSNGLDLPFSMHLIQGASTRAQNKLAIGGCVGDLSWSSQKDTSMLGLMRELFYFTYQSVPVAENSYMSTSGFVICGEKVQAASVTLPRKVKNEKKVVTELQKLKDSGICEENSFAFMFACCGRGQNHYRGKAGLESSVFNRMFPNTPLVGVFGNGEIGLSYIPSFSGESTPVPPASTNTPMRPGQYLHSYTTIFVMVSFGKC